MRNDSAPSSSGGKLPEKPLYKRPSRFRFLKIFARRGFKSFVRGAMQYVWGMRGQRRVHGWRTFFRLRTKMLLRIRVPFEVISRAAVARLWVDREAFPRVKKLLRSAQHTIVIQMFIWKDDELGREMAQIILDAADRGVQVEIWKEAVGDVFEFTRDFLTTKDTDHPMWKRFWTHPNIRITYSTRNDHTKVYIIDDHIMLLTGMNIANEYHSDWHDYMVELRGHSFVQHFLTDGEVAASQPGVRLVMNSDRSREIRGEVMRLLKTARRAIVLEQSYLSDPAVLDTLIQRSKEGVSVTVILPKKVDFHHFANMQSCAKLLEEGRKGKMNIFLYPRMVHGKIILIDREKAFVGSANLMTSSLDEMGEVNVVLRGRTHPAIGKLRDVLREDIIISSPLSRPPRFQWMWNWLTMLKL